jgi:prevent-host-death family protein
MINVGAFDAKTHLPALLNRVSKGETIQITRRGVPVAMLISVQAETTRDAKEAADRIREARKGIRLRGLRINSMINEGRR